MRKPYYLRYTHTMVTEFKFLNSNPEEIRPQYQVQKPRCSCVPLINETLRFNIRQLAHISSSSQHCCKCEDRSLRLQHLVVASKLARPTTLPMHDDDSADPPWSLLAIAEAVHPNMQLFTAHSRDVLLL